MQISKFSAFLKPAIHTTPPPMVPPSAASPTPPPAQGVGPSATLATDPAQVGQHVGNQPGNAAHVEQPTAYKPGNAAQVETMDPAPAQPGYPAAGAPNLKSLGADGQGLPQQPAAGELARLKTLGADDGAPSAGMLAAMAQPGYQTGAPMADQPAAVFAVWWAIERPGVRNPDDGQATRRAQPAAAANQVRNPPPAQPVATLPTTTAPNRPTAQASQMTLTNPGAVYA